ncbi:MAG: tetratricopeptide repeat protein [Candidatus Hodarchaeales archaeon]
MMRDLEDALKRLHQANYLMSQGKVDDARPLIESLEGRDDFPPDEQLTYQLLKSQLLITTGDFKASIQLAEQVREKSQLQNKPLQAVDACIVIAEALERLEDYEATQEAIVQGEQLLSTLQGESSEILTQRLASLMHCRGRVSHFWKGDYDQAMKYFQESLVLRRNLGREHDIANSIMNIGIILASKGNLEEGVKHQQQALKKFRELGNKHRSMACLINMGIYYRDKGDLDQALECFQQGQALCEELGNKKAAAVSQYLSSGILRKKGELNRALELLEQALPFFEELELKNWIGEGLRELGLIYWQQGTLGQSLTYLEQSLVIFEDRDYKDDIAKLLFFLVLVALDKSTLEQARHYLQRLQHVNSQVPNKRIRQRYRLAKALLLKASPRIKDKGQAQSLFEQVVDEKVIVHELTVMAMLSLCELLLEELKAYGEAIVFEEAKTLVYKLYALAQQHNSFVLIVDALILRASFALIEGKLTDAEKLLEQALLTAEEKNLGLMITKVSVERHRLEEQFERWLNIIQRNAPFQERLEQARLTDYLKTAKRVASMEMSQSVS